jgi:hypothetical protein
VIAKSTRGYAAGLVSGFARMLGVAARLCWGCDSYFLAWLPWLPEKLKWS